MRSWMVLVAAVVMAGCATVQPSSTAPVATLFQDAVASCAMQPAHSTTLYLGPDQALIATAPQAGETPGNGFTQGFISNDLKEWLGAPVAQGLWLEGNVTLELWVRSEGTPAPIVLNSPTPGEGYHLFNQFGSDRSLQPAYAVEYNSVAPTPGHVDHYSERLTLPNGGFVMERGDKPRLLLTGLTLDGATGPGQTILWGGDTPSRVTFTARCWPAASLASLQEDQATIAIPGNRGLLTGAVPAREGVNIQTVPFTLLPNTTRLDVTLTQTGGPTNPKSDMDLTITDAAGTVVWSIGSPYTNEHGCVWLPNLQALMPPGAYHVVVNAYSGADYTGSLTIEQLAPLASPAATQSA